MTTVNEIVAYAKSLTNQLVSVKTNPYGSQCVVLINDIVQHFTDKNLDYTNAIDCLDKAKQNGFTVEYDGIGKAPKKGACYIIDTREEGNPYGHIGIAVEDSDGTEIIGREANVDGFTDNDHDGINDQYQIGGPVRAVRRDWYADGTLVDSESGYTIGKMVGWFYLPTNEKKKGGRTLEPKNVNGDIFSALITDVDPNVMNADGNRTTIDRIVIHHNAGTDDSNSRRTWYVSTGVGTSAHYQVTPTKLWGCVGENSVAYHAGDYSMNQRSIGIEHLNETGAPTWTIAEDTYKRSAELIADICRRYRIPCDRTHIIKHSEVYPTACPGGIDIDKLVRMANDFLNGQVETKKENLNQEEEDMFTISAEGRGIALMTGGVFYALLDAKDPATLWNGGVKHFQVSQKTFDNFQKKSNLDRLDDETVAKLLGQYHK